MASYLSADFKPFLRPLGRTFWEEDGLVTDWSGAGFSLRFSGTGIRFHFAPYLEVAQPVYVRAFADGVSFRFAVFTGAEVFNVDDLPEGEHTLRFVRVSEPRDADKNGTLLLRRIQVEGETAALLPPPAASDRRILVVGDSITCGWGANALDENGFCTAEEDVTRSYSYLTAATFGADYQIVASSGQGFVCNCNGQKDYEVGTFFEHATRFTKRPYDHTVWTPDLVIINVGTNDAGGRVPPDEWGQAAEVFLDRVREVYPAAKVIYMYGMMGAPYMDTLREITDRRHARGEPLWLCPCHAVSYEIGEIVTGGHPSRLGQKIAARGLAEIITRVTGWEPVTDVYLK